MSEKDVNEKDIPDTTLDLSQKAVRCVSMLNRDDRGRID